MIAVTGATGQLGRLVINRLLETVPAANIIAIVRNPSKAGDLAARGVVVRQGDYSIPQSLESALSGVERLLLVSSNELGNRVAQHNNVIAAAKHQRVKLFVYTSLLHADNSPLNLAEEYIQTESAIKASGLPYVLLRNGWYAENYLGAVQAILQSGVLYGSARDGRISLALRADLADAAAKVLIIGGPVGTTIELAGDTAYTLADLAAEISKQSGRKVVYQDLPEADYRKALISVGLPEEVAANVASWDVGASKGALLEDGHQLSKLLGRPTTPLAEAVSQALSFGNA